MRLVIDRDELLRAARHGQRFCGSANQNPLLAHVLIRAYEGALEVCATNLQRSLRIQLQTDKVSEMDPGEALIPADRLVGILQNSTETLVTLEADATSAVIKLGRSRSNLLCERPEDFPQLPVFPDRIDLIVRPARAMIEMGTRCAVATNTDEQRFSFDAVCMIVEGDQLQGVSTDGKRLVSYVTDVEVKSDFSGRKLIDPRLLVQFGRLGLADDPVEIAFGQRYVYLRNGLAEVAVIERVGRFPPIEKVFGKTPAVTLTLEREALQRAVAQVRFVLDDTHNSIYLRLDQGAVVIHGSSSKGGEGSAEVPYNGEPGEMAYEAEFSPDLLAELLKVMEDPEIELGLRDPSEQIMLRELQSGVDYILMPIRQESGEGGE